MPGSDRQRWPPEPRCFPWNRGHQEHGAPWRNPRADPSLFFSYTQDSAGSLSALEATSVQPSSFLNLIPPAVQHYPQEGSHFYSTAPTLFSGIDVRSRLGSKYVAPLSPPTPLASS